MAIPGLSHLACTSETLTDLATHRFQEPSRPAHLGRPPSTLRRCRPCGVRRTNSLSHQHLRSQDLRPPLLPSHGSGHLQQTLGLGDLGRAGIPGGLLRLDPVRLLLHVPAAERVLGELQLRLRPGVHLPQWQYSQPFRRRAERLHGRVRCHLAVRDAGASQPRRAPKTEDRTERHLRTRSHVSSPSISTTHLPFSTYPG